MNIEAEWYKCEFIDHELQSFHTNIENELDFYNAVAAGNLDFITSNCHANVFAKSEGMGQLSLDPIQNLKYHFVVTTALVIRHCIHYGLEQEKAYCLSDFYIMKMDKCQTIEEISELHDVMCINLCKQMAIIKRNQSFSKHIILCLDYIYSHLHTRITLADLAKHLGLSPSYLSKLFSKEMGTSLSQYILELKIQKARNLLRYSEYSIVEIANYLSFASESHFIQVFEKKSGISPYKYRISHFRKQWQLNKNLSTS